MPKNKITTQGYFVRRLRNSGYITSRVYDRYQDQDPRKWTIVIDPDGDSVLITCWDTGEWPYRGMYELSANLSQKYEDTRVTVSQFINSTFTFTNKLNYMIPKQL